MMTSSLIDTFIVEDEPLAAEKLRLFLTRMEGVGRIRTFRDGVTALCAIDDDHPAVVFLDIEMPGLTGLEFMERLTGPAAPLVIITSAYEKYALSGFNFSVIDYLLKPYTFERLTRAWVKAQEALRLRALDTATRRTTLAVRTGGKTEIVDTADIIAVEAVKDYVRLVTPTRRLLVLATLSALEARLPAADFLRVHRSTIIGLRHVVAYGPASVTLADGTTVAVGRTYKDVFDKAMHANGGENVNKTPCGSGGS